MKFTIIYRVFLIPNDEGIKEGEKTFSFTYVAEISELGDLSYHVNEYLQKYFAKDNYELISMKRADEE